MPSKKSSKPTREQRRLHTQQIILSVIAIMVILAMVIGAFSYLR
jgi:hypothetical protein